MARQTIQDIQAMKDRGERIAMVTAYDATFGRLVDEAGADIILVGDSLGMVVQGHDSTLPVTMDHMVYHTQSVMRGANRCFVICDLPFMSYQVTVEDALRNGGRLLSEGACQAVKLEGGVRSAPAIRALVQAGIPVCGHIGLTPQSFNALGGFRVQGRNGTAEKILDDARAVEAAGAFCIVLEAIPAPLAKTITESLTIPTIGIGAGVHCDGQVLVSYDYLGLNDAFKPRFLKRYANLGESVREATRDYVRDVREGTFPDDEHSFS
jgi:3-methyl-2-oxobutanoate hydroxymethyltransferase